MRYILFILVCITVVQCHYMKRTEKRKHEKVQLQPTCLACTAAVSAASFVLKFDVSEPVVLEFATVICKLFAHQAWVVCDGISGQFREEFFYVFRQLSSTSPSQICGILLPDCADPSDPQQAGWEVAIPPRRKLKHTAYKAKPAHDSSRQLRVLHLSDIHIDFNYLEGSEVDCGLPVCCRDKTGSETRQAGFWGTVGDCDIPVRTFENMLQYANTSIQVDYVMVSGDLVNHVDWVYSIADHQESLRKIGSLMRKYFPKTPVFWALGNHEGVPVNSFAPHSVDKRFWPTWLYKEMKDLSSPWLDDDANKDVMYRGSYSTLLMPGLRLISLNTGFCETTNFFLYLNQSDPDRTMTWLVKELYKAEWKGEHVHLMAHIPPGDGECLEGWARNYYRVIQRFSDVIVAQFFGHVHTDYFTVFYEDMRNVSSKPISVAYATPSLTTFSNLNPAFRIYTVDIDNQYRVNDFEVFWTEIENANASNPPKWQYLYSAKEAYSLQDLSAASWNDLIMKFCEDDDLLQKFVQHSVRRANPFCGLGCEYSILCSLRMGHHDQRRYCPSLISHKDYGSSSNTSHWTTKFKRRALRKLEQGNVNLDFFSNYPVVRRRNRKSRIIL